MVSKEDFDIVWKCILCVILIAGVVLFAFIFRDFNMKGRECLLNPFVYGANVFTEKLLDHDHIDCSCSITNKVGHSPEASYYFTEEGPYRKNKLWQNPADNFTFDFNFSG